jgi:hypothetical protein
MNIIKFLEDGNVKISTIIGVKKDFVEKSKFFNSYKKKEPKIISPLIEIIEEAQFCPTSSEKFNIDEEFLNIEFMSSEIPIDRVEIDLGGIDIEKINVVSTMQRELAEALMSRDAANFVIDDLVEKSNKIFNE